MILADPNRPLSNWRDPDDAIHDSHHRIRPGRRPPDARLESLATFTRLVVRERGWVAGEVTERFLAAGYTRQQALEVVLGVTMKTLSNYANHLTGTTVNPELASEAWTAARAA